MATLQGEGSAWAWAVPGGSSANFRASPGQGKAHVSRSASGSDSRQRRLINLPVTEASQAGEARRLAIGLAEAMGFDETQCGRVALVVTETASNLARHAQDGELLLQAGGDTLEVLALDRGPGMADVARCLHDGFSTTGTAGEGLGAILRLSEHV